MTINDVGGGKVRTYFYITRGQGFLLLRNEILHRYYQLDPENLLKIPAGVWGIYGQDVVLRIYLELTNPDET